MSIRVRLCGSSRLVPLRWWWSRDCCRRPTRAKCQLKVPALPFAWQLCGWQHRQSVLASIEPEQFVGPAPARPHPKRVRESNGRPAVTAVVVTVFVLALRYRRSLIGRYRVGARPVIDDRVLFTVGALACPGVGAGCPARDATLGCGWGGWCRDVVVARTMGRLNSRRCRQTGPAIHCAAADVIPGDLLGCRGVSTWARAVI